MLKATCLTLHRWTAIVFSLPLFVIMLTGLVLSFEPLALQAKLDQPLSKAVMLEHLAKHDPGNKATGLMIRAYEQSLTLAGVGEDGETEIDLTTGEIVSDEAGTALSDVFRFCRGVHQSLISDMGWLVSASTIAMLGMIVLGLLMGFPNLRNTVGGWHSYAAWMTMPMVVISPLTGLMIAYGFANSAPSTSERRAIVPIVRAVEMLAEKHDLANLTSLRSRGGRMVARVFVEGALTNIVITASGLEEPPRNWSRSMHEGNWSGWLAPGLNIVMSVIFLGLLLTGLFIWLRRTYRRSRQRIEQAMTADLAE